MKLQVKERDAQVKKESKRIRRNGEIPAVVYSKGQTNRTINLQADEFHAHLRRIQQGHLSSKKFHLVDEKGNSVLALVKDIQYNPVNYQINHIDFLQLHDDQQVNVNVPLSLKGVADCAGAKLGGVIRSVLRYFKVRCLPKDIPDMLEIDVADMKLFQSRRLSSLQLPDNVRPLTNLNEIAVVIAKK